MKKLLLFLFIITLSACQTYDLVEQDIYDFDNLTKITEDEKIDIVNNSPNYENDCLQIRTYKVLQVLDDNSALAFECLDDNCFTMENTVLLAKQDNIDYFDNQIVKANDNQCVIRNGVYKYPNLYGHNKTVPIIYFEYANSDDLVNHKIDALSVILSDKAADLVCNNCYDDILKSLNKSYYYSDNDNNIKSFCKCLTYHTMQHSKNDAIKANSSYISLLLSYSSDNRDKYAFKQCIKEFKNINFDRD